MKNLLKKVLTLVSALALLVSSTAMVYAEEEQTEAPVAEASDVNAEAETIAAQQAEEAARIAAEEAAKKAAEEEAARIAAEEAAKKAAEEEAARIAAEEAAKKAAEEEAARIAAEEAAKKAAEEEAARIAAEEAAKQSEEVPFDNNNEETLSEEEEDSEDGEIVELSDDWGYVDPEIIADYVPEVTVELKYPDIRELKINEKLSGTIDAENNAEMFIRCGGNKTIVLGLYASSENVAVEINGNAVNFTKAEPATATTDFYSTYELKVAAGCEYTIILSSSTPVSYKITADDAAKQNVTEVTEETEEKTETEESENSAAAEENTEEAATEENEPAEETEGTENAEAAEDKEETGATPEENAEETSEEEGIEGSDTEEIIDAEITEEEVPPMKGWITADKNTFEVGDTIILIAHSDTALENMVAWQTKVQDAEEWAGAGYGETLTVELTEENINNLYRFRMEDGNYSDIIDIHTAPVAEASDEQETDPEEMTEEVPADGEEADPNENAEEAEDASEEEAVILTDEELAELGYRKVQIRNQYDTDLYDGTDENAAVISKAAFDTELWVKDTDQAGWAEVYTEDENQVFIKLDEIGKQMPSDEEMLADGYIKAFVAIDIGANTYSSLYDEEADGHLEVGAELWVKLIDGADRAQIFILEDDASVRFINLVDIIATMKPEGIDELPTREIKVASSLNENEVIYAGTIDHLSVELINFREDDNFLVQWKYSEDGETFTDIDGANGLEYAYMITMENASYIWRVSVVLVSPDELIQTE